MMPPARPVKLLMMRLSLRFNNTIEDINRSVRLSAKLSRITVV